jgi:uncharacterized protein (UPF0276 family)
MAMNFAVNFSEAAENLVRKGQIRVDRFKCPAWLDLIRRARESAPVYVHFPLRVGRGIGDARDTETKQPADWGKVETLLAQTDTRQVNLHLAPCIGELDGISLEAAGGCEVEVVVESMIRDVRSVAQRFGAERVVLENADDGRSGILRAALLPEVISCVVRETDCGFLLDIAHARLAARRLGMNSGDYIAQLPLSSIREMHLAGIQRFAGHWVLRAQESGLEPGAIQLLDGQLLDHLPLTAEDWVFYAWALQQVQHGTWGEPWIVALEYGGVGGLWEVTSDQNLLAEQVPRLYTLVKGCTPAHPAAATTSWRTHATCKEPELDTAR